MLIGEAENTNFNVFGLTRSGTESTTLHIRGKHATHYNAEAVQMPITTKPVMLLFDRVMLSFEQTQSFHNCAYRPQQELLLNTDQIEIPQVTNHGKFKSCLPQKQDRIIG